MRQNVKNILIQIKYLHLVNQDFFTRILWLANQRLLSQNEVPFYLKW